MTLDRCYRLYYGMKEFIEDMALDDLNFSSDMDDSGLSLSIMGREVAQFFLAVKTELDKSRPDLTGVNQFDATNLTAQFIRSINEMSTVTFNDDPDSK